MLQICIKHYFNSTYLAPVPKAVNSALVTHRRSRKGFRLNNAAYNAVTIIGPKMTDTIITVVMYSPRFSIVAWIFSIATSLLAIILQTPIGEILKRN